METAKRNIKLLIAYDGTDFKGWQRQEGRRTVQGTIEDALGHLHARLHPGPIRLTGSGRTDSGVHAAGQTANFYTPLLRMEAPRFVPALNSLLPQDVRILEAAETLPDFHARFDAKLRVYRYSLICGRPALPQESRYHLQVWRRPRLQLLNAYARLLQGEMDCSVFSRAGDQSLSRNRYIRGAVFFTGGEDTLIFEIGANAFLWGMVRSIVGTLLFCEERNLSPDQFREIIDSRDRRRSGPSAPAKGLSLWRVEYPHRGLHRALRT
jgi:tRNA pseudouridine38-40 synthase